jgi:hypothetical protein
MSETFLDERKFLPPPPPPPPPPIHILMQGMQESKQTMTYKICKKPKKKNSPEKQNPTRKTSPEISTSSTLNLPNVQNLKPRNETQMKERCTNTSNDFWKKIHKLPQTQETKPVTKLQRQSNLCCCTKQASKQARISPSPQKKKNKKK